jgi:hypothetical protein
MPSHDYLGLQVIISQRVTRSNRIVWTGIDHIILCFPSSRAYGHRQTAV